MVRTAFLVAASFVQDVTTYVPMKLGGDPRPETITQSFKATCGARSIIVELRTEIDQSVHIVRASVDGKDVLRLHEVKAAQLFLKTIHFPSLTTVLCPSRAISFVVTGSPNSGGATFYRVTIPLDQK
jgi:hypothetical protein